MDEAGKPPDDHGGLLDETSQETTRYLAAATQLKLKYARFVVRQIIREPFRAVAPAAGVDVVVVTRWALAALRRRAHRDAVLTCLLIVGAAAALEAWTWIPIAVVAVLAIFIVAFERWVRDVKILARQMLRGRFRPHDAPSSPSQRVEKRLAVARQQQNGNLVVFRGRSPFVGSGEDYLNNHIVVNVARGKKWKGGKRQVPIPFSTPELHEALETALKSMEFPDIRVGQRLYVNGEHVNSDPRLLPHRLGPPAADVSPDLLREGCNPASEARTYVCAEIGGWEGQLVVSLFARAVQSHGSLRVEWMFHVLPPLDNDLRLADRRYELTVVAQILKAMAAGVLWFAPALVLAPVTFARYAAVPLIDKVRMRHQSRRIRNGYVFNYGSSPSIRDFISHQQSHDFMAGDVQAFVSLAQHTLLRALRRFLKTHKMDMKQFADQEQTIVSSEPRTQPTYLPEMLATEVARLAEERIDTLLRSHRELLLQNRAELAEQQREQSRDPLSAQALGPQELAQLADHIADRAAAPVSDGLGRRMAQIQEEFTRGLRATLEEVVGESVLGPALTNFAGYLALELDQASEEDPGIGSADGTIRTVPGHELALVMSVIRDPAAARMASLSQGPDNSFLVQEPFVIEGGQDAPIAEFDAVADCATLTPLPRRQNLNVAERDSTPFRFKLPDRRGQHELWFQLYQAGRLIQAVAISVEVRPEQMAAK